MSLCSNNYVNNSYMSNLQKLKEAVQKMPGNSITNVLDVLLERLGKNDPIFDSANYLQKLKTLKTNLERVDVIYEQLHLHNLLPSLEKDEKSDDAAKVQRDEANKQYIVNDNDMEVLECYTMSIAKAKSKDSLALGYANRSACLFKMKLYKECIADIERVLSKKNCPEDLKLKLLNRKKKAEQAQKPVERFYQDIPKIPSSRRNSIIQCARNCIEIKKNAYFGRHVVATRDIQIGEVVCVEKCYAATLQEAKLIHCHYCLELCYNPIPCPTCTLTVFCSEDCKNKARKSHHKYECPILLSLVVAGTEPLHFLGLKIALLAKEEFERYEATKDECHVYKSDRYKEIHELMAATKERPAKDLAERAIVAAFMYHLLKNYTKFFEENSISEDDFKELLLLQMQIAALNHLAIYENIQNEQVFDCEMFGVGLYSFSSLFNHSCHPNVDCVQYGTTNVIRAVNTISKGQQCFITYSVQYDAFPMYFRQEYVVTNFYFTCKCEACEHNWMITEESKKIIGTLTKDLKMSQKEVHAVNMELAHGNIETARTFLQHSIPLFKKCEDSEPYGNAWKIKDLIGTCYKILGNRRRI